MVILCFPIDVTSKATNWIRTKCNFVWKSTQTYCQLILLVWHTYRQVRNKGSQKPLAESWKPVITVTCLSAVSWCQPKKFSRPSSGCYAGTGDRGRAITSMGQEAKRRNDVLQRKEKWYMERNVARSRCTKKRKRLDLDHVSKTKSPAACRCLSPS